MCSSTLVTADAACILAIVTRVAKLKGMSSWTYSIYDGPDIYGPPPNETAQDIVATQIFTNNMVEHEARSSRRYSAMCSSSAHRASLRLSPRPPSHPLGDDLKGHAYELGAFEFVQARLLKFET